MKAALDEARQGAEEGGIPIGAALVDAEGNPVPPEGTAGFRTGPWLFTGSVVQCSISTMAARRVGKLPGPRVRTEERLPNREFPIIQDRGWVVRRRLAFSLAKTQPAATVRKRDMDLAAAMPSVDSLEPTQ